MMRDIIKQNVSFISMDMLDLSKHKQSSESSPEKNGGNII